MNILQLKEFVRSQILMARKIKPMMNIFLSTISDTNLVDCQRFHLKKMCVLMKMENWKMKFKING